MRIHSALLLSSLVLGASSAVAAVQFPIDRENIYVTSQNGDESSYGNGCRLGDFVIRNARGEFVCKRLLNSPIVSRRSLESLMEQRTPEPQRGRHQGVYASHNTYEDIERRNQQWQEWYASDQQVGRSNDAARRKIESIVEAIEQDLQTLHALQLNGLFPQVEAVAAVDRDAQVEFRNSNRGLVEVEFIGLDSQKTQTVIAQRSTGISSVIQVQKPLSPKEEVRFNSDLTPVVSHVRQSATVRLTSAGMQLLQLLLNLRGTEVGGINYSDFYDLNEGDEVVGIVNEVDLGSMVFGMNSYELVGNVTEDGSAVRFNDFGLTHYMENSSGYRHALVQRSTFIRGFPGREGRALRRELRRADSDDEEAQVWVNRLDAGAQDSLYGNSIIRFRYQPVTDDSDEFPIGIE